MVPIVCKYSPLKTSIIVAVSHQVFEQAKSMLIESTLHAEKIVLMKQWSRWIACHWSACERTYGKSHEQLYNRVVSRIRDTAAPSMCRGVECAMHRPHHRKSAAFALTSICLIIAIAHADIMDTKFSVHILLAQIAPCMSHRSAAAHTFENEQIK